jgi:hypothetical protein
MIPICFVALLIPVVVLASGDEGSFDGVVNSIEMRYHAHATRLPFMALVRLIARKATHEGAGNLHVAEIESFSVPVDGAELSRIVEEKLGPGWEQMVRETSRKGNEQTLVFTHPEGDRMGLFVVDLDGSEMDVVQISVDPKHLDDDIDRCSNHRDSHSDGDNSD